MKWTTSNICGTYVSFNSNMELNNLKKNNHKKTRKESLLVHHIQYAIGLGLMPWWIPVGRSKEFIHQNFLYVHIVSFLSGV